MSSPHKSLPYSTTFWTVSFCLILVYVLSINTYPKCDSGLYGSPTYADCHDAFSSIPQDTAVRFFVEQQLRTAPPQADWTYFPDPRPLEYQQTLAQTPKWWSRGNCNIALLSYRHPPYEVTSAALPWIHISNAAYSALTTCVPFQNGGAAVVHDSMFTPALSLFVWEDGAPFDWLMNQYMTAEFPFPPDPTLDPLSQSELNAILHLANGTGNTAAV